jgi:hypothetical protein
MLGNLTAERPGPTRNTRFVFEQSIIREAYAAHLRLLFNSIVNMGISTVTRKPDHRTGNVYVSLMFKTLALPQLNIFRVLYHPSLFGRGAKIIPTNLPDLFTPVSFAY